MATSTTQQLAASPTAPRVAPPTRPRAPWHLLPFVVAALLVVAALHFVAVLVNLLSAVPPAMPAPAAARNAVSSSITSVAPPLRQPSSVRSPASSQRLLQAPAFPHNLRFGDATSLHTLTIFTDPACSSCNLHLAHQLQQAASQLGSSQAAIVVKYWPANPGNLTPGLLVELARRHGVAEAYWQTLTHRTQPATNATLFAELEQQGIKLPPLRDELEKTSPDLVNTVMQDVQQGQALQLPPPPVLILNGRLLP